MHASSTILAAQNADVAVFWTIGCLNVRIKSEARRYCWGLMVVQSDRFLLHFSENKNTIDVRIGSPKRPKEIGRFAIQNPARRDTERLHVG